MRSWVNALRPAFDPHDRFHNTKHEAEPKKFGHIICEPYRPDWTSPFYDNRNKQRSRDDSSMKNRITSTNEIRDFNPRTFLSTTGRGRDMVSYEKKAIIFAQGDKTAGIYFVQMGREPKLSSLFVKYLLKRNIRYQDDLVDQLFNSSEKRLARVLLLMAQFGKEGVSDTVVQRLSQETLAEMVGTTRSRVNFFMNRFRKLGFIHYDIGNNLQVHSSLLSVVLNDSKDQSRRSSAPPAERGGPTDKDRAKRPRLGGSN